MTSEMRLDGPVVIVQTDTDPGDVGEPRVVHADGQTIAFVPSFDMWRVEPVDVVCGTCGHPRGSHSSGGMCSGGGTECYCVRFPEHIERGELIETIAAGWLAVERALPADYDEWAWGVHRRHGGGDEGYYAFAEETHRGVVPACRCQQAFGHTPGTALLALAAALETLP